MHGIFINAIHEHFICQGRWSRLQAGDVVSTLCPVPSLEGRPIGGGRREKRHEGGHGSRTSAHPGLSFPVPHHHPFKTVSMPFQKSTKTG